MNAAPVNLEALAQLPREQRDAQLLRLRADRRDLHVLRDALAGIGWEGDIEQARQKRRTLQPGDVAAVLAGDALPPEPIADDAPRRLAAVEAAIRQLATLAAHEDMRRLQAEANELTGRLQVIVQNVLKAATRLPAAESLDEVLGELANVRLGREALRSPDIGDAQLPGLRDSGPTEHVAKLVQSGLQYLDMAVKAARDQ